MVQHHFLSLLSVPHSFNLSILKIDLVNTYYIVLQFKKANSVDPREKEAVCVPELMYFMF